MLYDEHGAVAGVATGDMGVAADGSENPGYQAGYELRAPCVIFAEGCRGRLGKELERRYGLREQSDPQHYGIGLKEVWNVDPAKHRPGTVVHTFGWPLDNRTEGGGFLYHAEDKQVYLAFLEHNVLLGRTPLTLHNRKPDHECLVEADKAKRIDYPRPDGAISFDKLSSVFVSNTNHEEDQPCHLKLDDSRIPVERIICRSPTNPRSGIARRRYTRLWSKNLACR